MCDGEVFAFKHKNQCWKCAQTVPRQFAQKRTINGRRAAPRTQKASNIRKNTPTGQPKCRNNNLGNDLDRGCRKQDTYQCFPSIILKNTGFFYFFLALSTWVETEISLLLYYNHKEHFQRILCCLLISVFTSECSVYVRWLFQILWKGQQEKKPFTIFSIL